MALVRINLKKKWLKCFAQQSNDSHCKDENAMQEMSANFAFFKDQNVFQGDERKFVLFSSLEMTRKFCIFTNKD